MNLNTNVFDWHSDTQTFSQEISTLRLRELPSSFILVSNKTSAEVVMNLATVEKRDGDVLAWRYVPKGADFNLVIFND